MGEKASALTSGCCTFSAGVAEAFSPFRARHHSYRPPIVSFTSGVTDQTSWPQAAQVWVWPLLSVWTAPGDEAVQSASANFSLSSR